MKLINYEENKFLISFAKRYSIKEYLEIFQVEEESYGEEFAIKFYNIFFNNATDAVDDYEKYYSEEYDSFEDYLFWRHQVPICYCREMTKIKEGRGYIGIFISYSSILTEQNIFTDSFADAFKDK